MRLLRPSRDNTFQSRGRAPLPPPSFSSPFLFLFFPFLSHAFPRSLLISSRFFFLSPPLTERRGVLHLNWRRSSFGRRSAVAISIAIAFLVLFFLDSSPSTPPLPACTTHSSAARAPSGHFSTLFLFPLLFPFPILSDCHLHALLSIAGMRSGRFGPLTLKLLPLLFLRASICNPSPPSRHTPTRAALSLYSPFPRATGHTTRL